MNVKIMKASDYEELEVRLRDIENARKALKKSIERIRGSDEAPCKPGDIVEINGWAHRGKKMQVAHVVLRAQGYNHWGSGSKDTAYIYWVAHGWVLEKDGTPGRQHGETTWTAERRKVDALKTNGDT